MTVNEEWFIIPRELEEKEIIHQNHIKHGIHLKVNPTLKEIKKFTYDCNNTEKDIINFYFKCITCGIRTSEPRRNYAVKHIESNYPKEKYQVDTTYLANYISKDSNI